MTTPALARANDKRYFGVVIGLVTDVNDPAKRGRVKLKFPWFDEAMESDWARIATLAAGNGYGSFWIPQVGDEVVTAFEFGDMRFPFVLGGVYNGVDLPPSDRSDTKDQVLFKTKHGHSVLLDDSAGQEKVEVKTKGGHSITLDDISQEVTVECNTGQSVTLGPTGATIKGVAQVTLEAAKINLGSAAASSLVLGEALLLAFNTHTHNCTAPGTPSGPPITQMTNAVLSTTNKTS